MSARGRKSGTESTGKEGSGGGDGEGDDGVPNGYSSRLRSGPSSVSYRDKLLSPDSAGFLVKHTMEDDIMQGWKEFFNKMNEKETQALWRTRMKKRIRRLDDWRVHLVLGASFPTYVIRDRINRMWRPNDPLKRIPLSNGYYIVSFSNKEDREYAFQEGPWMIEDHYLTVPRWRPNFNPWKADFQCIIAAWIRLPDIPFEFYNVESLQRIGNMVGKMIKIDRSTSVYDKGGFARICVEIDLKKPLLPTYMVFGEERHIVYEGLHQVCFVCGKYGHQQQVCPTCQTKGPSSTSEQENVGSASANEGGERMEKGESGGDVGVQQSVNTPSEGGDGGKTAGKESGLGGGATIVTGGDSLKASPFGKIRILRHDYSGHSLPADMRKGSPGNQVFNVAQNKLGLKRDSQLSNRSQEGMTGDQACVNKKQEINIGDPRVVADKIQTLKAGVNGHKVELIKEKGPPQSEWVKVSAKKKSVGKGKAKGKENRSPPSQQVPQSSFVAQDMEPTKSFSSKNPPVMQASSTLGSLVAGIHSQEHGLLPMHNLDELMGTGAKSFPALVCDLKSHYELDFLAILETRYTQEASVGRVQQLGFPNMELIQCEGYSGGIWCFWDHSISSVTVLERHHQFVHLLVTGSTGQSWMFTVVYASTSCVGRQILWENLSRIAQTVHRAWLIGGDFNGTLLHCERRSSATFRSSTDRGFRNWVDSHEVRDMGFVGPEFTWKREDKPVRPEFTCQMSYPSVEEGLLNWC
ncbi:hypothetical protein K1719_005512 [Acacia pycnantha]|nr:hypothetical protein K1719_005512 [Acacia pycnantha]